MLAEYSKPVEESDKIMTAVLAAYIEPVVESDRSTIMTVMLGVHRRPVVESDTIITAMLAAYSMEGSDTIMTYVNDCDVSSVQQASGGVI